MSATLGSTRVTLMLLAALPLVAGGGSVSRRGTDPRPLPRPSAAAMTGPVTSHLLSPASACVPAVPPTGIWYHVVVDSAQVGDSSLVAGSVIMVLDGNLAVGAATYQGSLPLDIPAIGADSVRAVRGFRTGDPITMELCRDSSAPWLSGLARWQQGGRFGDDPYSEVAVTFLGPVPVANDTWGRIKNRFH